MIWIALLSILGLALSSWVKWRVVATGIIFAAVFVPAGVGGIVSAVLRTKWGFLLNVPFMMSGLWQRLLGAPGFDAPDRLADHGHCRHAGAGLPAVRRHAECAHPRARGGARMNDQDRSFRKCLQVLRRSTRRESRFADHIPPGITTLVGTQWLRQDHADEPDDRVGAALQRLHFGAGPPPGDATEFFRDVGYCTQFDLFPRGLTGLAILDGQPDAARHDERSHGRRLTHEALERVQLGDAASRKIAGYSKGMRQKIRLAQAIAHHPRVLVLDEPLNGLDPMARAESHGIV